MSVQVDFDSFRVDEPSVPKYDVDELSAGNEDHQKPGVLDHFHNERGWSAERIAREVFDDELCGQTILNWLDKHELKAPAGTLLSKYSHTGADPMIRLGQIARENGDSTVETTLEELLERYGDELSDRSKTTA
ncbi:hypothetical protein [Natronorubrum daqingense]|uniref:Uncharacterized protein n=1 Tax=Natronorubrum daqingense TaxID=588898 RepID=A0A1N7FZB7_9EURY|nr:hypothetical protein [Natronorubrum daqingense]APX98589.1 hypothetical protein BB347_17980 [Natronorubrum daqingense]SIS05733.1 hypothetical protein SAMN05421809_3608 [Natronorubrum daqingense]